MSALNVNQGGAAGTAGAQPTLTIDEVNAAIDSRLKTSIAGAFDEFKKSGLAPVLEGHISPLAQQLGALMERINAIQPTAGAAAGDVVAAGAVAGAAGGFSPEANAKIRDLEAKVNKTNADLTKEMAARETATKKAETAERASAIRAALSQEALGSLASNAKQTAFDLVEKHIRRLDDGTFVAGMNGDNLPIDVFAKEFLTRDHDYLFRSTGVSGSGAASGGAASRNAGMRADINSIRPGMSREQREAAAESILAAMQATG